MWMCYREEGRAAATDVKSAVMRLKERLGDLAFDASHEAVYGFGKFLSEEECLDREKMFYEGVALCEKFLNNELCELCLVKELIKIELHNHVNEILEFLCKCNDQPRS